MTLSVLCRDRTMSLVSITPPAPNSHKLAVHELANFDFDWITRTKKVSELATFTQDLFRAVLPACITSKTFAHEVIQPLIEKTWKSRPNTNEFYVNGQVDILLSQYDIEAIINLACTNYTVFDSCYDTFRFELKRILIQFMVKHFDYEVPENLSDL